MIVLSMVAAYAIAIWITAFIMGILDERSGLECSDLDEMEWFMCAFWPFTLVCVVSIRLIDLGCWLWGFVPGKRFIRRIVAVVAYAFRPHALGMKLAEAVEIHIGKE